jgi:hypothetical protein
LSGQDSDTSRSVPQQIVQMSPPTAGHARFARRFPHILQSTWIGIGYGYYRISAARRRFVAVMRD